MKTSLSWEIIAVGVLIIGVSVYLLGKHTSSVGLNQNEHPEVQVYADPTNSSADIDQQYASVNEATSAPLENHLRDSDEDLDNGKENSSEDTHRYSYQPLAATTVADVQTTDSTDQPGPAPIINKDSATETGNTIQEFSDGNSYESSKEPGVTGILGTVLTHVSRVADEVTGNSDFSRKYGGDDASMVKSSQFDALGLGRIQTDVSVANILLKSHDSDQVVVELWLSDRFELADFEMEYALEVSRNRDVLNIRIERIEQETGFFSRMFGFFERGGKNIQPGIRILVPDGALTYELNSGAGNIEVFNTGGDIVLQTRAGNLRIGGLFGHITADTRAGNIRAEHITGNMILRSRAGNIDARNIDAHSELRSTAGNIRLTIQSMNHDLDLETRVGNIHLEVPEGFAADVSLDASQISVPAGFEVTGEKTDRYIRGEMNGGGPGLKAHTRVGNLTVRIQD
jgi:hypothetical protein